jgi:hypothetical protein
LTHLEIGGRDLEWIGSGQGNTRVSLVEAIVSSSVSSLVLTQSHLSDSDVLSTSTRVQHPQRLLQVATCLDPQF